MVGLNSLATKVKPVEAELENKVVENEWKKIAVIIDDSSILYLGKWGANAVDKSGSDGQEELVVMEDSHLQAKLYQFEDVTIWLDGKRVTCWRWNECQYAGVRRDGEGKRAQLEWSDATHGL